MAIGCKPTYTRAHFRKIGTVIPDGVANGGDGFVRSMGVDSGAIHVPRV